MDEDSQECRLHNALFSTVHRLHRREALECRDSTFILINSFVGRKASRGSIRLITGIYSVLSPLSRDLSSLLRSLHRLLQRKRNATAFGGEQGERGGSPLCLLLSVLATPSRDIIMHSTLQCSHSACVLHMPASVQAGTVATATGKGA